MDGERAGLLVGYAGLYDGDHQFVGEIYVNFAKAERDAEFLGRVAWGISDRMDSVDRGSCTGFCGAPEGGKALAVALAMIRGVHYMFPEKEVTRVKTDYWREESKMKFGRHEPLPGEQWWIVEDVCNNFSTTRALVELIEERGARVKGIVCALNRSPDVEDMVTVRTDLVLPVVAVARKRIMEYRQDDPFVAEAICGGKIIWKPKDNWAPLAEIMAKR